MLRIELLIDARAELGEGPPWDIAEQRLYWIDSLGAKVNSCDARGGAVRTWDVPDHIGSLALRENGGAVVSLRDGFYALANGACRKLADPDPGKPRIRMNDGKVDRHGRFVADYMDYEERDPICALFRLDPTGAVAKLDDGIVCSNGPCWSPDGRTFHFADTYTREIWAYDYDTTTGAAKNRRVFSSFPAVGLNDLPDGATVDADGFVCSVSVYEGETRPLRARRPAGPRRRPAGREYDQPQLRRSQSGWRVCDLDGARGEWRDAERAGGWRTLRGLRSRRARPAGAAFRRLEQSADKGNRSNSCASTC